MVQPGEVALLRVATPQGNLAHRDNSLLPNYSNTKSELSAELGQVARRLWSAARTPDMDKHKDMGIDKGMSGHKQ